MGMKHVELALSISLLDMTHDASRFPSLSTKVHFIQDLQSEKDYMVKW